MRASSSFYASSSPPLLHLSFSLSLSRPCFHPYKRRDTTCTCSFCIYIHSHDGCNWVKRPAKELRYASLVHTTRSTVSNAEQNWTINCTNMTVSCFFSPSVSIHTGESICITREKERKNGGARDNWPTRKWRIISLKTCETGKASSTIRKHVFIPLMHDSLKELLKLKWTDSVIDVEINDVIS